MPPRAAAFDIRKFAPNPRDADPITNAVYDRLNCLIRVLGDVPCATLLQTPFAELMTGAAPRVRAVARARLLGSASAVLAAVKTIARFAPEATMTDFYVRPRHEFPAEVMRAMVRLRREGLLVPMPIGRAGGPRRASVVRVLLKDAPRLTLLRAYTEPRTGRRDLEADAYLYAKRGGFMAFGNDHCCCLRGGVTVCLYYTGLWCTITPTGSCAKASNPCPGGAPGGGLPPC